MIAIVTETLSCLNADDCRAFGVFLAPMTCVDGDRVLPDRILSGAEALSDGQAHSVPPSEAEYRAHFDKLLQTYGGILCLTASRKFSDSYRHANLAALSFGGRVIVLDSHSVAGGLFLLVFRARHFLTLGFPMSRIKAELESYRNTLRVAFTANSAAALESAQRLSYKMPEERPVPGRQPVFHIKRGGIGLTTFATGESCVMEELLAVLDTDGVRKTPSHVVIHYADRTEGVTYLLERIAALYPSATVYERPITLSLQVNLGKDIVGLIAD